MKRRLLVIGNGMVSYRFLEEWVKLGGTKFWQTVCYGEEPQAAYDRIHLSSYFSSENPDALALNSREWYSQQGIDLHLGIAVTKLDRVAQEVTLANGQKDRYDLLVFASGSHPFLPP